MGLIFQLAPRTSGARFLIERPGPSLKWISLQTPAKRGMKAFDESPEKQFRSWPHPSLVGEAGWNDRSNLS
jgi:hypothetical protein